MTDCDTTTFISFARFLLNMTLELQYAKPTGLQISGMQKLLQLVFIKNKRKVN